MFLNDKCIQTFITEHSFLIIVCKDHPHMYVDWSKKESKFDTSTKTNFYKLSLAETKTRMHFIWEHTFILINNIVQKLYFNMFVWANFIKRISFLILNHFQQISHYRTWVKIIWWFLSAKFFLEFMCVSEEVGVSQFSVSTTWITWIFRQYW